MWFLRSTAVPLVLSGEVLWVPVRLTRAGSSSSFSNASFLMRATRWAKRHVEMDSCRAQRSMSEGWIQTAFYSLHLNPLWIALIFTGLDNGNHHLEASMNVIPSEDVSVVFNSYHTKIPAKNTNIICIFLEWKTRVLCDLNSIHSTVSVLDPHHGDLTPV